AVAFNRVREFKLGGTCNGSCKWSKSGSGSRKAWRVPATGSRPETLQGTSEHRSWKTIPEGDLVGCHFGCHCTGKTRKRTQIDESPRTDPKTINCCFRDA